MDSSARIFALICACLSACWGRLEGNMPHWARKARRFPVETDNEASHAGLASRRVPLTEPVNEAEASFVRSCPESSLASSVLACVLRDSLPEACPPMPLAESLPEAETAIGEKIEGPLVGNWSRTRQVERTLARPASSGCPAISRCRHNAAAFPASGFPPPERRRAI